jgi:hypothetical protein
MVIRIVGGADELGERFFAREIPLVNSFEMIFLAIPRQVQGH